MQKQPPGAGSIVRRRLSTRLRPACRPPLRPTRITPWNRCAVTILIACAITAGCDEQSRPQPDLAEVRPAPLPVQQTEAYPETATGLFVSLADFEDSPKDLRGYEQVGYFHISPSGSEGVRRFVVNVTRTGAGAMEVLLPPKAELVFSIPELHDFTGYTLLSVSLYSETLRDDLRVTLTGDRASWSSHRKLVQPGWNTVLIDIQRLGARKDFDATAVRTLRISFTEAISAVRFNLDDVMLINNYRSVKPAPPGLQLYKDGLDYKLLSPHGDDPVFLAQCDDGLWRLRPQQPAVQLAPPNSPLPQAAESLELMGPRRLGHVELIENNTIRLRLANTWYFPTHPGEWASLAVRQIRWEYTFYANGRWVTQVELNNAGGTQIGAVRISLGRKGVWAGKGELEELIVKKFAGPVGRWSYLLGPEGPQRKMMEQNYLNPGLLIKTLAAKNVFAAGDADEDGFDESQGCYFLQARAGNCRFMIVPGPTGLLEPVFRVAGQWAGAVNVSSEGLVIRNVVRLGDGTVLFSLPGRLNRPTKVEVSGKVPLLGDR